MKKEQFTILTWSGVLSDNTQEFYRYSVASEATWSNDTEITLVDFFPLNEQNLLAMQMIYPGLDLEQLKLAEAEWEKFTLTEDVYFIWSTTDGYQYWR